MKTKLFPRKFAYLVALAILVIASFIAGSVNTRNQAVSAQGADTPAGQTAPDDQWNCTPDNVAVFPNRIHVYCFSTPTEINYLAYPSVSLADSRLANRYLAILTTALATNRQVTVYWDNNAASNPPGCNAADCRLLTGLVLLP